MRTERIPSPGILVMGVLFNEDRILLEAEKGVSYLFGPISRRSREIPFRKYTDYYEEEMGKEVIRCFWSFGMPFPRGALAEVKLATNRLERILAKEGKRAVNLDPGLLTAESLILATTKPYSHRVYLAKGIYGDLTLTYREGGFEAMPWTYPDYREDWARDFFREVRWDLLKKGTIP